MIVAGFGFRAGASEDSLRDALVRTGGKPAGLATVRDKATTEVFEGFARALELPVLCVPDHQLAAQLTLTQSDASHAARETGSVAEAAALAAAGPNARLLAPRVISSDRMATCALAESPKS